MGLSVFGPVWDGCGVRGFSGEGYWFHKWVPGLSFDGSTFVAKTITRHPNIGNMKLRSDYTPKYLLPDCISVYPFSGVALNSVGLSGPGIEAFLKTGRWQSIQKPFFLSFMPISKDGEGAQEREATGFVEILGPELPDFASEYLGLQLNVTCPNVGANLGTVVKKAEKFLSLLAPLQIPIVVKLNLLVSPEAALEIAKHPATSGICIANTIPFGELPDRIPWKGYFPDGSPLVKRDYGGGGLSGTPLLPLVAEWVARFRKRDANTYINAGGGVMHADDVDVLMNEGANSIFFATVAMLRPWRVPSIIARAHEISEKEH